MMDAPSDQPTWPRDPRSQGARAILAVAGVAVLGELILERASPSPLAVEHLPLLLGGAAAAGFGAGLLLVLLAGLVLLLTRVLSGTTPPRATHPRRRALCLGTVPTLCGLLLFLPALDGPWIAAQAWTPTLRIALWILTPAAALIVGRFLDRALHDGVPGGALGSCGLILLIAGFGAALQRPALRNYPSLALAAILFAFAAAALLGASRPRGRLPALIGNATLALAVLSLALLLSGLLPGEDPVRREVLLGRAPLASRLLAWTGKGEDRGATDVDEALLASLLPPPPSHGELLDRRLPDRRRFNLLVVSIDTLRHDRLGARRDGRPLMPNLERLAAEGHVFRQAYSQFPSSALSFASLFTGRYPTATDFFPVMDRGPRGAESLASPTLAHRFVERGHRSFAVTAFFESLVQRVLFYLPRGFQTFNPFPHPRWVPGKRITRQGLAAIDALAKDPFFLWVHYIDPHNPYERHGEFDFGEDEVARYDSEVAFADRQLGRILEHLEARSLLERTVVVVHSDHGEEFGEHGGTTHNSTLYEEQLRVPLVIRVPGLEPGVTENPVQLVDVTATLAEIHDLEPLPGSRGFSLVPELLGVPRENASHERPVFFQLRRSELGGRRLDGLRLGRWKLIHDSDRDRSELFDLEADPGEKNNLILSANAASRSALARLRSHLAVFRHHLALPPEESAPANAAADGGARRTRRLEAMERLAGVARRKAYGEEAKELAGLLRSDAERLRLVRALGDLGDVESLPALERLQSDASPALRRELIIARALCGQRDEKASSQDDAAATLIARALVGPAPSETPLVEETRALRGRQRLIGLAARAREVIDRASLQALLESGRVDGGLAGTLLRLGLEEGASDAPAVAYLQTLLPGASEAMLDRVADFAANSGVDGLSIGRRLVARTGTPTETWRERVRYPPGIDEALLRADEARLAEARRHTFELKQMKRGAALARELIAERIKSSGAWDWAAIFEAWQLSIGAQELAEARALIETALRASSDGLRPGRSGNRMLRRLRALGDKLDHPREVAIEIGHVDPITTAGAHPWCAEVIVKVHPDGASLAGGAAEWVPRVAVVLRARDPKNSGYSAIVPLPLGGLLPGESITLPVPARIDSLGEGLYDLQVFLFEGKEVLAGPVSREIRCAP